MATTFRAVLPGTSGNYFSRADVNLLPADDAHGHQSVGNWTAGAGASALVVASASAPATMLFGDQAFKATTDGTGAVIASLTTPSLAAVEHTVGIDIYTSTAGREAFITLDGTDGTVTPLTAGTLTRIEATKTVTSGTKTVTVTYRKTDDSDPAASEVVWMARACLRAGSDSTFVPSLRIVGDLDIETKIADTFSDTDISYLMHANGAGANGGYAFLLRNDWGVFRFDYTENDGTTRSVDSGALSWTDGQAYVLRGTWDVTAGTVVFYRDGVQVRTLTNAAYQNGGLYPASFVFQVGILNAAANPFDGDMYYLMVRDGIGGPIVARFDADDWSGL